MLVVDLVQRDARGLAIDPATVAAGEESYHACNIFWLCATAQGTVISHELLNLLSRPLWSPTGNIVPSILRALWLAVVIEMCLGLE